MNKFTFQKLFLILLPVMAVGLATTNNSVTVFDPAANTVVYGSYFELIPESGNYQILPPAAGILAVAAVILGILYMVREKPGCLKGILWIALISASAAALPIALQGSMTVVPNVGLPLLMCAQAGLAYVMAKRPEKKVLKSVRKLKS